MPPHDSHRYRSTALDRALSSSRTVACVGPVAGLDADRARAVLATVEGADEHPYLALEPDAGSRRWRYRRGIADCVSVRDDLATDDLGALLTAVNRRPEERSPLEVLLCGDYVVVDYNHGIGDGQLGLALLAAMAGDVDRGRARTLAQGLPPHVVRTALRSHFGDHPKALRDAWRLRAESKEPPTVAAGPTRTVERWRDHQRSVTAYMPNEVCSELRAWAKTAAPGATGPSLIVAAWMSALQAGGVTVDDRVMILMNCRRYLRDEYFTAQGNFAVGIPLRMPASGAPGDIAALTRQVLESGWPVAILGMAELKALASRGTPQDPAPTEQVPSATRLSVSDLGRLRMFDHVTWTTDGRPPQVAAYLPPDGPDAISVLVSELGGGRTFTATFCTAVTDADLVARALDRVCTDPQGALKTVGT